MVEKASSLNIVEINEVVMTKSARQEASLAMGDTTILVGVDDGYAMTKVATLDGRMIKIPSSARPGVYGVSAIGGNVESDGGGYETEGQKFTVGDFMESEGTRFDDYPFSALNRVIVHHALKQSGFGSKNVKIATGLPVTGYFLGDIPNLPVITKKRENLMIDVSSLTKGDCANIVENHVFSEGVSAWVDYAINDNGEVTADLLAPVGVIDIGGRTTDCVVVLPGWRVDHARSGTGNIGVLDMYESVAQKLRHIERMKDVGSLPHYIIENAVQSGTLRVWGENLDVSSIVKEAKHEVGERILREVQRRVGRGVELDRVLFVGGGAVVFDNLVTRYANGITVAYPEFANARGMLKYMRYVL